MSDTWEKKWQQSDLEAKFAQEEAQQKAEDNVSSLAAQLTGHIYIGRHIHCNIHWTETECLACPTRCRHISWRLNFHQFLSLMEIAATRGIEGLRLNQGEANEADENHSNKSLDHIYLLVVTSAAHSRNNHLQTLCT